MTKIVMKDQFLECTQRIAEFNHNLAELEHIAIAVTDPVLILDEPEKRALQLVARSHEGTAVVAAPMGGLSGARALRAAITDHRGRLRASYFVKLSFRDKLQEESINFRNHVSSLLEFGTYPALVREIDAGIRKRRALLYQIADGYDLSLFDLMVSDEAAAVTAVNTVRSILSPWEAFKETQRISMGTLRASKIDDVDIHVDSHERTYIEDIEAIQWEITTSYQHGDLHASNILCKADGSPLVVDFGNVGRAPSCTDPVLLELSVLFHLDSPLRRAGWPTSRQTGAWFDLDEYLRGCPIPNFISQCPFMGT